MEFKLEYLVDDEIKTYILRSDTVTLGKLPSNDICLEENSVSRKHCKFIRTKKGYKVEDLDSTNGTFLNGKRVKRKILKEGDSILIGRTTIKYLLSSLGEELLDLEDQKISKIIPLSDRLVIKEKARLSKIDLNFLDSLTDLGKNLISSNSLKETFKKAKNLIQQFLDPTRLYIFSYDDESNRIQLEFSFVHNEEDTDKVNISSSIAMKAIKEKVAILSSNTLDDSRFSGAQSIIMYGIRSALSVPIWTKSSIYGLVYVDTTDISKSFATSDLEMLSVVANFVGLSIESIKSLEKLNREKKIRAKLERYHSPQIASKIMKMQSVEGAELMPHKEVESSVLFMDIAGFSSRVENMAPGQVGKFLNTFFTEMTDIIFKYNGTLDKYLGDGLMAVFGVPFEIENHAELAILSGLEMITKLEEINRKMSKEERIKIRIGINSGRLISGDFGSPKRIDYTVLGNTVNVASRLESYVAKPGEIVISEYVHENVADLFIFEPLGEKKLPGISRPINVFIVKARRSR